ncbi:MAG: DNA methylase [Erysipelotrichaceae bacterium]|nr:DNA methylase [Erysipelotrichaceae bacterium]MDY5252675.1 DNA methylase [Erysipelotrichaceae bacterium]
MADRQFLAIDLKAFYASVECVNRHLDPFDTYLVVADEQRSAKTICLAISPALKALGISGRPRLFEVEQKIQQLNQKRQQELGYQPLTGQSVSQKMVQSDSRLAIDYVIAKPHMAFYIDYSAKIYEIYLRYVAPEDIHVYSIDEVFMDVTNYLGAYKLSAKQLAYKIMQDILQETGISATAGSGTNLYLAKIAMDIVAKNVQGDHALRIAQLDERTYRQTLWDHQPLTHFWRVGKGYERRLNELGLYTMGDIARYSIAHQDRLYQVFGKNAKLLIDHAWGYEPCTIKDIKAYEPKKHTIGSSQVLACPYNYHDGLLVVKEMVDLLALELVDKRLVCSSVVLTIGYDIENMQDGQYEGNIKEDNYGRLIPKPARGIIHLKKATALNSELTKAAIELYQRITNEQLWLRRVNLSFEKVIPLEIYQQKTKVEQLDLFADAASNDNDDIAKTKEQKLQETILDIKQKYGKNALLKGMNLQAKATTKTRNKQIGGHNA